MPTDVRLFTFAVSVHRPRRDPFGLDLGEATYLFEMTDPSPDPSAIARKVRRLVGPEGSIDVVRRETFPDHATDPAPEPEAELPPPSSFDRIRIAEVNVENGVEYGKMLEVDPLDWREAAAALTLYTDMELDADEEDAVFDTHRLRRFLARIKPLM